MGRVGRMGSVGKREHHLSARQCKALGNDNADARPRSRPYRLSCPSRLKITRDPRDERDERDEREVADNCTTYYPFYPHYPIIPTLPINNNINE